MILLDSSALVCAALEEAEAGQLARLLNDSSYNAVGAPLVLEAGMVLTARGYDARYYLTSSLESAGVEILDFRKEHQVAALSAFARFGKGRHPARLNFGDCMSYAYAQMTNFTLIFKGADFGLTDLPRLHRLDG